MTLDELIDELTYIRDDLDTGNVLVHVAVQPSWPLAHDISTITVLSDDEVEEYADEGDGLLDEEGFPMHDPEPAQSTVWIALEQGHPYNISPYAPRKAWGNRGGY